MSGRIKLVYTISKDAFDLIRRGGAVLESGGVRDTSGRLLELAVPGKQTIGNGPAKLFVPGGAFSGINMASSLACNVQCAFIQKGVNEANIKLDELLTGQNQIISGLQTITGLEIANLVVGLINVGVSLVYLSKIKAQVTEVQSSLDELKAHLDDLRNHIEKQEFSKYKQEYIECSSYMSKFIETLRFSDARIDDAAYLIMLSHTESYLETIIEKFNEHEINGTLGCNIIFGLVPLYVQAIKIYSSKFCYKHFEVPEAYNRCLEIIGKINSDTFRNEMKRYLLIDCPQITMENKYKSFSGIMASIQNCIYNLEFEKDMWAALPQKDYENLDQIIMDKIKSDDSIIEYDDNRVYIPIEV